ncbi:MAG: arginine--tRNA ligase [Pseudonocardia sp.]
MISDLNGFYKKARKKYDADAEFAERTRRRVVALQGGDGPALALWRMLVAESQRHFEMVYRALGMKLTAADSYGESFYKPVPRRHDRRAGTRRAGARERRSAVRVPGRVHRS